MFAAIYWGGLIGIAVLSLLVYTQWRSRKMARLATTESCLLCDTEDVDVASDEASYRCRACGYDSQWSNDPMRLGPIEQFRDLKNARYELISAEKLIAKAQRTATMTLGGNSSQKYVVLEQATSHLNSGLRLLTDLIDQHPRLLDMPVPAQNIDQKLYMRDISSSGLLGLKADLAVRGQIKKARADVAYFCAVVDKLRERIKREIVGSAT